MVTTMIVTFIFNTQVGLAIGISCSIFVYCFELSFSSKSAPLLQYANDNDHDSDVNNNSINDNNEDIISSKDINVDEDKNRLSPTSMSYHTLSNSNLNKISNNFTNNNSIHNYNSTHNNANIQNYNSTISNGRNATSKNFENIQKNRSPNIPCFRIITLQGDLNFITAGRFSDMIYNLIEQKLNSNIDGKFYLYNTMITYSYRHKHVHHQYHTYSHRHH